MKNIFTLLISLVFVSLTIAQVSDTQAIKRFEYDRIKQGLNPTANESTVVSSVHTSSTSGIQHIYFQQKYSDIPIYMAVGSQHFFNGKSIERHDGFETNVASKINTSEPNITARQALQLVLNYLNYSTEGEIRLLNSQDCPTQDHTFENPSLSEIEIPVSLVFQPTASKSIRLAWNVSIQSAQNADWWNVRVDAVNGDILDQNNWTVACFSGKKCNHQHNHQSQPSKPFFRPDIQSKQANNFKTTSAATSTASYRVYEMPLKTPDDGNRTLVTNPEDSLASPFGWLDIDGIMGADDTITRGNNCYAYEDGNNSGFSPGNSGLIFDFPIDTVYSGGNPSEPAAITNLFYWSNIIHDLWYHYGFTEDAGNFQENNYGRGGAGNDWVRAEAQDGSGSCNANMATPSDGSKPRMQMYVCGDRDGDLDNVVIAHEYAHGVSNRLTGGPQASGCLNNSEQMGEGWSDFFGLIMTIKSTDQGPDAIGIGTWLFGEPLNGAGIREYPYSTDMSINQHTYADVANVSIPHGVGSVWCEMLWEMTWALIDVYGFDSDFYFGTGGNNIAMNLVMEGMKLQPCRPGFVDGRDAILLADQMLYGGANQCLIWEAFAKRGLGFSANQGSNARGDETEAFDVPDAVPIFWKEVDKIESVPGDTLTYTISVTTPLSCNDTLLAVQISDSIPDRTTVIQASISNGGSIVGNGVVFPFVATLYAGDTLSRSFSVVVDTNYPVELSFYDDIESGGSQWLPSSSTGSNSWSIVSSMPFAGDFVWFAPNVTPTEDLFLELDSNIVPGEFTELQFWHMYDTEMGWDGGVVQYSLDQGSNWFDLGPFMTQNGYNSMIDNNGNTPAFAGQSNGYILTKASLSAFEGDTMRIRFWMSNDPFVSEIGWYIDNVAIRTSGGIPNTAYLRATGIDDVASLDAPTQIVISSCEDGLKNGFETGIDCGGPDCPDCLCDNDEIPVLFTLDLDSASSETTWQIRNQNDSIVYNGGPYPGFQDSTLSFQFCMPVGCYSFVINDSGANGICCNDGDGFYNLVNLVFGDTIASGSAFGAVDSTYFCINNFLTPCDSLLQLTGQIQDGTYHAGNIVRAQGNVNNSEIVVFKAEDGIELNPEFTVQLGAEFSAEIEACTQALNKINDYIRKNPELRPGDFIQKE